MKLATQFEVDGLTYVITDVTLVDVCDWYESYRIERVHSYIFLPEGDKKIYDLYITVLEPFGDEGEYRITKQSCRFISWKRDFYFDYTEAHSMISVIEEHYNNRFLDFARAIHDQYLCQNKKFETLPTFYEASQWLLAIK